MCQCPPVSISVDLVEAAYRIGSQLFKGRPLAEVRAAEERYRKFLHLCAKYPDQPLAPTKDIDEMWHLHMLHPRAYVQDCLALFGCILDHDGGFGAGSPEEEAALLSLFNETARLWRQEFNEPYVQGGDSQKNCIKACARCAVRCRKACRKDASTRGMLKEEA